MKLFFRVVFWILSAAFALLALAFFFAGVLSGALMLGAAVIINPLFIQGVRLKKGITALLVIGLFIASIGTLPAATEKKYTRAVAADIAPLEATNVAARQQTMSPAETQRLKAIPADTARDHSAATAPTAPDTPSPSPADTPSPTPTSSPTPTATPSPAPTPTRTPRPTPTPTKQMTRSSAAGIVIIDYTDSVSRGSYASIEIKGTPNTTYTCNVRYKSGMSTAQGLGEEQSDAQGYASWRWKVGTKTSLDYTPTIYIEGGGDSVSVTFDVIG